MQHIDFVWYRGELESLADYELKDSAGSNYHPVLALRNLK